MRRTAAVVALIGSCVAALALAVHGSEQPPQTGARIALTFDDLPVHGPLPPGLSRVQVARSILDALKKFGVREAYGFINAKPLDETPEYGEVLRLWRAAGYPLGNHAYSHMDLHANPVESFEHDILANEATLRALMTNGDWRWFRFPFLREGETPEKYAAVRRILARHGYRVAQVTVSFDDYAYNDPYVRCAAQNDRKALDWLEQSYLDRAAESLARSRAAAERIFGRDISHVMLLHVGAFQTVMLPRLLDLLGDRGFTVVTLHQAQTDEAYATEPRRAGPRAGTFLDQVEASPPPRSPASGNVFARLGALCRATQH